MESAKTVIERPATDHDIGKENMIGKAIRNGSDILCPVPTTSPVAIAEQSEVRAYKLGKRKFSYNQVELVFKETGGRAVTNMRILDVVETPLGLEVDEVLRESCVKFNVRFINSNQMVIYVYLVYSIPYGKPLNRRNALCRTDGESPLYHWVPVTRDQCSKGCEGPLIRGIQRFGKMPKRSGSGGDSWKDGRHLYVAVDEASTHVSRRYAAAGFRFLLAAYDSNNQLLGTSVSSSFRVFCNNDAPLGPPCLQLHCHVTGGIGGGTSESIGSGPVRGGPYHTSVVCRPPLQEIAQVTSPQRLHLDDTAEYAAKHNTTASQASRPPFDFDLNVKILSDGESEDGDGNVLSQTTATTDITIVETSDARKTSASDRSSLSDLCERLLHECMARQTTVSLKNLARALGARSRRILEILDVLETIRMVRNQGKEKYLWLGSTQVSAALLELKDDFQKCGNLTLSLRTPGTGEGSEDARKPLIQTLSKQFLQLFLKHENLSHFSWEQMLENIIDDHGCKTDPEFRSGKTRWLKDVACIFDSVQLVKKVTTTEMSQVYKWLGSQGVVEHLVKLAASTGLKKTDRRGATTRRRRSRSRSPDKVDKKRCEGI
ncbi:hypothetical protein R1flu_000228 [Riccia fluitans]|uniref:E2F/DP family winged-helix DNA-binding domain-containing protein n=1 Tax=Riccia fluitans TaxID=41844 RepID=A0ABD1XZU0_9MARC